MHKKTNGKKPNSSQLNECDLTLIVKFFRIFFVKLQEHNEGSIYMQKFAISMVIKRKYSFFLRAFIYFGFSVRDTVTWKHI